MDSLVATTPCATSIPSSPAESCAPKDVPPQSFLIQWLNAVVEWDVETLNSRDRGPFVNSVNKRLFISALLHVNPVQHAVELTGRAEIVATA